MNRAAHTVIEQEADAYLHAAMRLNAHPRVRIADGRAWINGVHLGREEIYAERIRLQRRGRNAARLRSSRELAFRETELSNNYRGGVVPAHMRFPVYAFSLLPQIL